MKRPGRAGLSRNAAIVLGSSGDRYLPVLQATAQDHEARWCARRRGGPPTSLARELTSAHSGSSLGLPSPCRVGRSAALRNFLG